LFHLTGISDFQPSGNISLRFSTAAAHFVDLCFYIAEM
jgi:hypothetical protein